MAMTSMRRNSRKRVKKQSSSEDTWNGTHWNDDVSKKLITAADSGDILDITILLSSGADIDYIDKDGYSALIYAVANDDGAIVQELLAQDADVNLRCVDNVTALHIAAQDGHHDLIDTLLEWKASLELQLKSTAETPLLLAINTKDEEAVAMLVNAGANTNAADIRGCSALYKAAQLGSWRIAHTLAKCSKTNIEFVHPDDLITPVMVSVENGHLNTTRMLAKSGADINRGYEDGTTPLMFALNTPDYDMFDLLVAVKADVEKKDKNGFNALMVAAEHADANALCVLLNEGADEMVKNNDGKTAADIIWEFHEVVPDTLVEGMNAGLTNLTDNKELEQLVAKGMAALMDDEHDEVNKHMQSQDFIQSQARAAFLRCDLDGDKAINLLELTAAMAHMGLRDKLRSKFKAFAEAEFKRMDKDGNELINFEEFLRIYNEFSDYEKYFQARAKIRIANRFTNDESEDVTTSALTTYVEASTFTQRKTEGYEIENTVPKTPQSDLKGKPSLVRRASATKLPSVASEPVLDGSKAVEVDKVTVGGAEFKTRFSDMVTVTKEEPKIDVATASKPTPVSVVAATRTQAREKEAELRKHFKKYDADKSGYVTKDELLPLMHDLNISGHKDEIMMLFHQQDVNEDNRLNFWEFVHLYNETQLMIVRLERQVEDMHKAANKQHKQHEQRMQIQKKKSQNKTALRIATRRRHTAHKNNVVSNFNKSLSRTKGWGRMSALKGSDRMSKLKASGWKEVDIKDDHHHSAAAMGHKIHAAASFKDIKIAHHKHQTEAGLNRVENLVKETSRHIQHLESGESTALLNFFRAVVQAQDADKHGLTLQFNDAIREKKDMEICDEIFAIVQVHHAKVTSEQMNPTIIALNLATPTNQRHIFDAVISKIPMGDNKWSADQLLFATKLTSLMLTAASIHAKLRELTKVET